VCRASFPLYSDLGVKGIQLQSTSETDIPPREQRRNPLFYNFTMHFLIQDPPTQSADFRAAQLAAATINAVESQIQINVRARNFTNAEERTAAGSEISTTSFSDVAAAVCCFWSKRTLPFNSAAAWATSPKLQFSYAAGFPEAFGQPIGLTGLNGFFSTKSTDTQTSYYVAQAPPLPNNANRILTMQFCFLRLIICTFF